MTPWTALGRSWKPHIRTIAGSEQSFAPCVARHNGGSWTAAARTAGVVGKEGTVRKTAFDMKRTEPVIALLAAAAAESGHPAGGITELEIDQTIARLIRSRDASSNRVGVELYDRREQRKRELSTHPDDDGFADCRLARDLAQIPYGACVFLELICDGQRTALSRISLFHEIYWRAMRDAPAYVETIRQRQSGTMLEDLAERISDLDGQRETRAKLCGEVGVSIEQADAAIAEAKAQGKQS